MLNYEKIKELRLDRGWSMAEAAKASGFEGEGARSTWSKLESGRFGLQLSTLDRIAVALNAHPGELLLDPRPKPKPKPAQKPRPRA